MAAKTIRLIYPQWQGGMNQDYDFGAQMMSHIIPVSNQITTKTILVPIDETAISDTIIDGQTTIIKQMKAVTETLLKLQPDRVITIGGDCAVSQAPFDYLHGRYPKNFGIIWLDAHPDVANQNNSTHVHEMVLANLMHEGASDFNDLTQNPVSPTQVFMAGLQTADLRLGKDDLVTTKNLTVATPEQLMVDSDVLLDWLEDNQIEHVAIHFDLDVLTPQDFHNILPAEPALALEDFGAAVGGMTLSATLRLLQDVANAVDLVGLTISEHMPWDAMRLRSGLSKLEIFD